MTMPIGMSIQIGVSFIDPKKYSTPIPPLPSAEIDAGSMSRIAAAQGFWTRLLLNAEATAEHALDAFRDAASHLQDGDIFLIYFSGHGVKVVQSPNPELSEDAWLLYDRMVLRSELRSLISGFRPGVRVLAISDSCNSGGIISPETNELLTKRFGQVPFAIKSVAKITSPLAATVSGDPLAVANGGEPSAMVLLLASSGADDASIATPKHGLFTQKLLVTWSEGEFAGNYVDFHSQISRALERFQVPVIQVFGPLNSDFASERPFTI